MTKTRALKFVLLAIILTTTTMANAANTARIRIMDADFQRGHDSAGKKIHELTVVTKQYRAEMWGTLKVYVQMKDKSRKLFFGSASFRQPRRSSGSTSIDKWVFQIISGELEQPKLTGLWVIYSDNANPKNFGEKKRLVRTKKIEDWIKSNKDSGKLVVKSDYHQIKN